MSFDESPLFSGREKLVMSYARELTRKAGSLDGEIPRTLAASFSPPEIVELTMTICVVNVFNRFNDVLTRDIDLDLAPLSLYQKPLES